jgi:hypothetical protein
MVIRACLKEQQDLFEGGFAYKSLKIDCFKMSKRFEVDLERPVREIDLYGDYIVINFKHLRSDKKMRPVTHIINKHTGSLVHSIDFPKISEKLSIDIIEVERIIIP